MRLLEPTFLEWSAVSAQDDRNVNPYQALRADCEAERNRDNAEQVKRVRQILEGLSLEIATPEQAREMLTLKGATRSTSDYVWLAPRQLSGMWRRSVSARLLRV